MNDSMPISMNHFDKLRIRCHFRVIQPCSWFNHYLFYCIIYFAYVHSQSKHADSDASLSLWHWQPQIIFKLSVLFDIASNLLSGISESICISNRHTNKIRNEFRPVRDCIRIESVDSKIINESVPISMNYF